VRGTLPSGVHGGVSPGADDVMPGFGGRGGGVAGDSNEIPGLGSGGIGLDVEAGVGAGLCLTPEVVRMIHRCPQRSADSPIHVVDRAWPTMEWPQADHAGAGGRI